MAKGRRLEKLQFPGARQRLGAAANAQLAVNIVEVLLHRADGDNQALRNLRIGTSVGDQAQDFEFAFREQLNELLGFVGLC